AHQRYLRIVHVQIPLPELFGDGILTPEVHHVQRADRSDIRHLGTRERHKAILGTGADAADQEIRNLGRRYVNDSRQEATIDQLFHRLPANPGRMEYEAFVVALQCCAYLVDARRGHAEHGEPDLLLVGHRTWHLALDHAGDGVCRVAQHDTTDAVDPCNIGDRIHHADVTGADIGSHIPRSER